MTTDSYKFGDLGTITAIVEKSVGTFGDNELSFAFPEVLEVIQLCSANQIAVLGVELFKVRDGGMYNAALSVYDLSIGSDPETVPEWPEYVKKNNAQAEEFVRQNPAGDDHVYVLTAASWREHGRFLARASPHQRTQEESVRAKVCSRGMARILNSGQTSATSASSESERAAPNINGNCNINCNVKSVSSLLIKQQ